MTSIGWELAKEAEKEEGMGMPSKGTENQGKQKT